MPRGRERYVSLGVEDSFCESESETPWDEDAGGKASSCESEAVCFERCRKNLGDMEARAKVRTGAALLARNILTVGTLDASSRHIHTSLVPTLFNCTQSFTVIEYTIDHRIVMSHAGTHMSHCSYAYVAGQVFL